MKLIAADWTQWRGPNNNGISEESEWNPKAIAGKPKVLWEKNVFKGYSPVTVKNNYLFTMGNDGNDDFIFCLDAKSGKEKWQYKYASKNSSGYEGPRCAPALDGTTLYTFSRNGLLICLNGKTGEVIWQKDTMKELGAGHLRWAMSSSPIIHKNIVIVNAGKHGMAFDKESGKSVWSNKGGIGGYASPVPFELNGKEYVAIFGEVDLFVVSASDGTLVASYKWKTKYKINAADPVIFGDKIFISSGYGKGCALLKFTGNKLSKLWQNSSMGSHFSSPILIKNTLYGIHGNIFKGNFVAVDVETGNVKWSQKTGFGSFIYADGKFIFLSVKGNLVTILESPVTFKEVANGKTSLGKTCWTMPVLANGKLYCRNDKGKLLCIDMK